MSTDPKPTSQTAHATTTGDIVAHLRALADAIEALGDQPIEKTWVNASFQVSRPYMSDDDRFEARAATVDLLASAFDTEGKTDEKDGWHHGDPFIGLSIYAAREKKPDPVIEIRDRGWELAAYDAEGKYLGGARRTCIGGSRGRSWYWPVEVGSLTGEGRRKADARTELLRLATEFVAGAR